MPVLNLPRDRLLESWPVEGHLAILDLEFTCWEGSLGRNWSDPDEWREVVDIGCMIVDATDFAPGPRGYSALVRPVRSPRVSTYFEDLTGITQSRIDAEAVTFPAALDGLARFLADIPLVIHNGGDGEILRENCQFAGIAEPPLVARTANIRPLLGRSLEVGREKLVSSKLPELAGLQAPANAHTALDDCRSIASALAHWRRTGRI